MKSPKTNELAAAGAADAPVELNFDELAGIAAAAGNVRLQDFHFTVVVNKTTP
jgi:hypothetical protein